MKAKQRLRTLFALLLVICMVAQPVALAAEVFPEEGLSFTQVDDSEVTASLLNKTENSAVLQEPEYDEDDIVRVTILVEGDSVIDRGYGTRAIAENDDAMAYRQQMLEEQSVVQTAIEQEIGQHLDVEWNLALIANIISANVEYGQIEEIKQVEGVEDVLIEQFYYPDVVSTDAETNMVFSGDMVSVSGAWESGYTGAGTRVAIIDTGLDTDHQSVSAAAYEYALALNAAAKAMDYDEYVASLDLLDAEEIREVMPQLNAYGTGGTSPESLYINSKIPYGFSYATHSYDVTHDNDSAGNHGAHVAGIAAANRFVEQDGEMVDALDTVFVTGNAPDAQILVMDVFGDMGASNADILAGVEDAILLGADTINLSLGTTYPGFSTANSLGSFLEKLKNEDTVVVISAGNSYDWAYLSRPNNLYADDVNTFTMGEPGSGTNSLSVASVENTGKITSGTLTVGGQMVEYNETFSYSDNPKNTPIMDMDTSDDRSGTEYEYIYFEHYSYADSYEGYEELVDGKIVLVSRGDNSFSDKANNAMAAGAIAVIVYNNVAGSINMDLSEFTWEAPCVFITKDNAAKFVAAGEEHTGHDEQTYYTGTVTITKGQTMIPGVEGAAYEMSYFSSWGVTGDLVLKPEISAPGGYIYSIDGGHKNATDRYTTMSGTSMAAPQVAGIGALTKEYIKDKGYTGSFANNQRGLVQSILMSTATPIKDANGNYYPVIQQGAGMANALAATSADSYIKMNKKATDSYDDGKVKAELGDDPERTGEYTFRFELHNLDGQEHTYDLFADVFAQDSYEALAKTGSTDPGDNLEFTTYFMDRDTRALDGETVFAVGGETVESVTVAADGMVTVDVTITLSDSDRAYLEEYFKNGTYIQAYVFAEGRSDEEGVSGTCHSIPVLAFYGNWTDPSMFYGVSTKDGEFFMNYSTASTTDNTRWPYFVWTDAWQGDTLETYNYIELTDANGSYIVGGNPMVADADYMPERNAIRPGVEQVYALCWLSRNATEMQLRVTNADTGASYGATLNSGEFIGAYLNNSASGNGAAEIVLTLTKQPQEGERVQFALRALPEYYNDGKMGEDSTPGTGATASVTAVVDGTRPEAYEMELDAQANVLRVTAADDRYVAAVIMYSGSGDKVVAYSGSKQEIGSGETAVYELDLSAVSGKDFLIQVFDYATNMSTYRVEIEDELLSFAGAMLAYDQETNAWSMMDKNAEDLKSLSVSETVYNAATSIGDTIFAVADSKELYTISTGDLASATFVQTLAYSMTDLAYNQADGSIYGVTDENLMVRIDPISGDCVEIGRLPITTNTLACDAEGTFYSNKYGTGEVYAYTLDTIASGTSDLYDFNGDGDVNALDSQRLLDYVVGVSNELSNAAMADVDSDGDVDTYDVYLLQELVASYPTLVAVADGIASKYLQSMEADLNSGKIYWASYFTDYIGGSNIGFSFLYEIEPASGEITRHYDYWNQLTGLVILDLDTSSSFPPIHGIKRVSLSSSAASMAVDEELELQAGLAPWNTIDRGIIWTSSDESVAVVDENGVVTAVSQGDCVITAVSAQDPSLSAACAITVGQQSASESGETVAEICAAADQVNNSRKAAYLAEQEETVTVDLRLTAAEPMTNGLQEIDFDADLLELLSVSTAGLSSYTSNGDRAVVGFVPTEPAEAGETVATLTFRVKAGGMEADMIIRELQRNNEHLSLETAANLKGHIWSDWTLVTPATCGEDGVEARTCVDCAETETRAVPATGEHTWGTWSVIQEPTETEEGSRIHICSVCSANETDAIHVIGVHVWSGWTVTMPASCGGEGTETQTCEDCDKVRTRAIAATGEHQWGEWTVDAEVGQRTRTCSVCGETQTKDVTDTADGTPVDFYFNKLPIDQDYVRNVQISGANVNSITQLEVEPQEGEDNRLHYVVELSQYANDVDSIQMDFTVWEQTASGIGSALKSGKVGSVGAGNDGDDLHYEVDISSGVGSMECYSYYSGSHYTTVHFDFVIGDTGEEYIAPYKYYHYDSFVSGLAVWGAEVVKESTFFSDPYSWYPPDHESTVESCIWLDPATPDDAVIGLQLIRSGAYVDGPADWSTEGGYVQLVDGEATISAVVAGSEPGQGAFRCTYIFYLKNHYSSLVPELLQGSEVSLQAELGVPFSLDLRKYFADRNGDELSYTISVDGGEASALTGNYYRFTPTQVGTRVLTVVASDEYLTSEVCTITIHITEDHDWSDWLVSKAATCLEAGEDKRICARCGEIETRVVEATGAHDWSEWLVSKAPTGSRPGTQIRSCLICGETETQDIPATGETIYGDVNADGKVSITDTVLLARHLAHWADLDADLVAADVNVDGVVDVKDIILLRRAVAGWDVTLGQ